ncbi:YceI family protein [Flavobacterium cucumis]|uniref:YceI-like domain-containing protein n=1 Tax=Flavobacterium cucumis TaxID=416016 RepID=A0A1M7ZTI4_9FLAO|nr:YceI family protein [Flavobacterium cucumis]SHO72182.1 YceI-like domain-containing protein [Flavobacterium cucumis]
MSKFKTQIRTLLTLLIVGCNMSTLIAQESKVVLAESNLKVLGTSNLHDWEINAKAMSGKASLAIEANDLKAIKNLDFSVEVEQLKSGKSGMDNNTFKALNSKTYKTINFKLVSVTKISEKSENNFTIETQGDLTISGVTKRINQTFAVKLVGKKAVFSGKTKIDMTVYGVKPPTALMGTIKTGKDVTVDYKVTYN